ncbi:TPA: ead/Ea22-like family protein [Enterobacter hormaechei]|nr:ead/Ea22-like family protein [Enterobacter hormaechei]
MSNIDKHALRERAESTIGILENIAGFEPSDIDGDTVELRFENKDGFDTGCDVSIVDQCQKAADVVLALLDELEAKDKRIAELSHHLQCAHAFIEHTEAFGHEASNGILCCGDAQWNIDESKSALAAAGKGEES